MDKTKGENSKMKININSHLNKKSMLLVLVIVLAVFVSLPGEEAQKVDTKTERAVFAGGCFWGMEYYFQKQEGVLETSVGFSGGTVKNPTTKQVSEGKTGHAEALEVVYDPAKVSYEKLTRLFFEIHDPTQINRQGDDIGEEYRSEIFYLNPQQKKVSQKLINILKSKGFKVATKLTPFKAFYSAEDRHQDYYKQKGGTPPCHVYTKRF
jgi:peptide methionine sulfoxide reductase msrA/msrB